MCTHDRADRVEGEVTAPAPLTLLPCPFCGFDTPMLHPPASTTSIWSVGCPDCSATGPLALKESEAVKLWNRTDDAFAAYSAGAASARAVPREPNVLATAARMLVADANIMADTLKTPRWESAEWVQRLLDAAAKEQA